MKIITTQEGTVYKLIAESDSLSFWTGMGYQVIEEDSHSGKFQLAKVCPYIIKKEIVGLSIVISNGKEGVASRWGNILLPCTYNKVELMSSNEQDGLQTIHFIAHQENRMEIFEYLGEMPIKIMSLSQITV